MKRRHVIASMGAFTASGSMVIGSGAFTSAEVDRSVSVDVVGDENAFLGLLYPDENGEPEPQQVTIDGGSADLLFAINQFGADIDEFEVDIPDSCLQADYDLPNEFTPGEGVQVTISIEDGCDESDCPEEEVPVDITAGGDGFSVEVERSFEILCPEESNQDGCESLQNSGDCYELTDAEDIDGGEYECIIVDFSGGGNAEITINNVHVNGSICIQEAGGQLIKIENSTVEGDINIDVTGNIDVELENTLCVAGDIVDNLGGSASLTDEATDLVDCDE